MIFYPPPTIERPQSINNLCGGSVSYTALNCIVLFANWVCRGQSFQYVLVYNFTIIHALSHRSDVFACSSRVNIYKPVVRSTITLLSAVAWVELPSFLISSTLSDSQSLNTSLLDGMISSKNEQVFIHDLSDLTLEMLFDAWWASMNLDSKSLIAWNYSRHLSSWQLYLHCGIEGTGSPGIICIVCHQVLHHPSEHRTSSKGKHMLAKAHIAKLNELTGSEVSKLTNSTVNEPALAILQT